MKKIVLCLFSSFCFAQSYSVINQEKIGVNLRGLSFESEDTFVVSGSNNTIGITNNGGKSFKWISPSVVNGKDFRDIEIISENSFFALSIGSPANIIYTNDGGVNWSVVYENTDPEVFLSSLYFDQKNDIIYAIGTKYGTTKPVVLISNTSNPTLWTATSTLHNQPTRLKNSNEIMVASSGGNLYADENQVLVVTGGESSVLYRYTPSGGRTYTIPKTVSQTSGANAITFDPAYNVGYFVGGDFMIPSSSDHNIFKFKLKDDKIEILDMWNFPKGYKSGVTIVDEETVVVCGSSGVEYTKDGGFNWREVTSESYNTCLVAPDLSTVILVGNNGKIGKLTF